jgi:hypothetical protein
MCDYPEFYSETYPRARKVHHCCECHQRIRAGYQYARCAGKQDGVMFSEQLHIACRDFVRKVEAAIASGCGVPFGYLDDALKNFDDYGIEVINIESLRNEWQHIKMVIAA